MTVGVAAIIQARMGSTRLPGKSLMNLAGVPLVGRVLERVKSATLLDQIILAIPDTEENKVLEDLANHYQVDVFLGSEDDVLDRYYKAALSVQATYVVRIPADNPTPQGSEIDRIIQHHIDLNRPGFSSNLAQVFNSGYPDGIGAEVIDFILLAEAWENENDPKKREHVHLNFFDYITQGVVDENWCPVSTIQCPIEFARPDIILDVNTPEQYKYMSQLYDNLYPKNPNFGILEIIKWHDEFKLNQGIGV